MQITPEGEHMKKCKKIIAMLLALAVFMTGCTNNSITKSQDSKETTKTESSKEESKKKESSAEKSKKCNYDFSIYEDEREFSEKQLAEQEEFEEYLKGIFIDEMSDSTVNAHFLMEHPENYGVEKTEVSWGQLPDYTDTQSATEELNELLDKLQEFDYDALTYEQQLIYDTFERYLETTKTGNEYPLFSSVFSPISGIQGELPIIFSEYAFLSKEDIDDYITLLNTSYSYIEQLCNYELYRMENGYTLTENSLDKVIEQCNEFINEQPNCLRPVFEEKLNQFSGLTDEEKNQYMEAFDQGMQQALIPAYQLMINTLTEIKGQEQSKLGLCNYENGSDYYEYLVRENTGSNRTVDELYMMIQKEMERCALGIAAIYAKNDNLQEDMNSYEYPTEEPDEMLSMLQTALEEDFPKAVNEEYTLNYVPESLESTMSPAFYLIAPIDNPKKNIIYINQGEEYGNMDLFPTVAHEGFPGHMYQTDYFYSLNPHYFRSMLSFNGYSEGWAQYIETCYAYKYSGMNSSLAKAFEYNTSCNFALYCMVDIGVNYYGWDYDDTADFLSQYVGDDEDVISEVYYTMIDEPTVYLRYYIGYLEILSLKKEAKKTLGKAFDIKEFHKFLLEIGPCQYDVIEDRMQSWMERVTE